MFEKTFYNYKCPLCGKVESHYSETSTDKWVCPECIKDGKTVIMAFGEKSDARNFLTS